MDKPESPDYAAIDGLSDRIAFRQGYIREELTRMSETLAEAAKIDLSNQRHRMIIPKNIELVIQQLVRVMAYIAVADLERELTGLFVSRKEDFTKQSDSGEEK